MKIKALENFACTDGVSYRKGQTYNVTAEVAKEFIEATPSLAVAVDDKPTEKKKPQPKPKVNDAVASDNPAR